jgi:WD40 repeat protein
MKWSTVDSIVCGGNDHQIKIMDVTKQAVQESIFTQHKTMTAVDTSGMMVLAGMEDGLIKVFDLRSQSTKAQSVMEFAAHQKWVSQVKCNPQSENVFLSAGYDGKVKMWDLRNATEPLSTLKRATAGEKDKVFGVAWNGASQILSGGVDSHISVHEM